MEPARRRGRKSDDDRHEGEISFRVTRAEYALGQRASKRPAAESLAVAPANRKTGAHFFGRRFVFRPPFDLEFRLVPPVVAFMLDRKARARRNPQPLAGHGDRKRLPAFGGVGETAEFRHKLAETAGLFDISGSLGGGARSFRRTKASKSCSCLDSALRRQRSIERNLLI